MEEHVPPTRSMVLRGVISTVLVLFVGVMLLRGFSSLRKKAKKKPKTNKALSLKVETKKVLFRSQTLNLQGYGTATSEKTVEIVPEVSGRILYTVNPFKEGTVVKKGQLLFRINPSDYSIEYKRLQAQLQSTKKQIAIAQRAYKVSRTNLNRSRRLVKRRALDQSSYERSQQAVLDRGQRLESLRQSIQVTSLLMRRASLNLGRTGVRAPFDARISRGSLTRGSFVSMGRSVATLESINAVEIPISFALRDLQKIQRNGKPVPLKEIPTFLQKLPPVTVSANGSSWKGRVSRLGAKIDLSTRTLTMYVLVDLKKQNEIGNLLPGTFCNVTIPVQRIARGIQLPRRALYNNNTIYIAQKKRLVKRQVNIAYLDSESVLVVGGLQDGDQAITTQLADPIEGTPVFTHEN